MKSFNDLRSTNSKEEATWKASLAANEAIVSELTHKVEDLTASIAKTTQHVDLLNDQFIQRESMVKERERIRKEMKQVNLQIEAHIIKELELKKLITEARQISDNQAIEMNKIKKRKSDVDLLRARNDEEDDALKPVRQELPRLVAISDDVSREISNLQETIAANEQTYQSELLTMERSLEETIKQVRERKKEVEERREILEKTEAALRELNKATLEEIEQHRNLKSNFDAAYETQAKLVARKEMEIAKIRSERIEAKKLERLSEEISLEKLQCGVRIIQETERIEKEYMEKIKELEVV